MQDVYFCLCIQTFSLSFCVLVSGFHVQVRSWYYYIEFPRQQQRLNNNKNAKLNEKSMMVLIEEMNLYGCWLPFFRCSLSRQPMPVSFPFFNRLRLHFDFNYFFSVFFERFATEIIHTIVLRFGFGLLYSAIISFIRRFWMRMCDANLKS